MNNRHLFSALDGITETAARLEALLHLSHEYCSGGDRDDLNAETLGFSLMMARQELDQLKEQQAQAMGAYRAMSSAKVRGKVLKVA